MTGSKYGWWVQIGILSVGIIGLQTIGLFSEKTSEILAIVFISVIVLDEYRERLAADAVDELVTPDGLRTDQAALGAAVEAMGLAGLQAARAEATAKPTSSAEASATVLSLCPVAGFQTGWLRPEAPATRALSM